VRPSWETQRILARDEEAKAADLSVRHPKNPRNFCPTFRATVLSSRPMRRSILFGSKQDVDGRNKSGHDGPGVKEPGSKAVVTLLLTLVTNSVTFRCESNLAQKDAAG
jgi:hypothetical protein